MNKTLEAWLRGYVYFKVNGEGFWTYNAALAARKQVPYSEDVMFTGYHLIKGWLAFYILERHRRPWKL